MRRAIASAAVVAIIVPACASDFGHTGANKRLVVTLSPGTTTGSAAHPLALSVSQPTAFITRIEARLPDDSVDTTFNGFVRLSIQPGTVSNLAARNVQLHAGVADNVVVPVVAAFGDAHLWAEDIGYLPASPTRTPPPQCSNGIDDNNNGLIDFPADPGCFSPVDDTEDIGTYATGVSPTLYFARPRVADVRGYAPASNGNGNATLFPHQQVDVDTGWRGGGQFAFSTVVIRIAADGLYAQDIQNDLQPAPGYGGVFAFTFSTPPAVRVCDRLKILSGQASDFHGFTELGFPTWLIEPWDPSARPCMVPEPAVLGTADLGDNNRQWQIESTLVRVQTAGNVTASVAKHLGPGNPQLDGSGNYQFSPDATNCDFDHNGRIEFDGGAENACADQCNGNSTTTPGDNQECSEWSSLVGQNNFVVVVRDTTPGAPPWARVNANASAAARFDPVVFRGKALGAFTGTLRYFSGGSTLNFTIEARCDDDIVTDVAQPPLTSDRACVHPRTILNSNENPQ